MRATSWLLGLAAVWIAVAGPARAGDSDASFKPVEFIADADQGRPTVHRISLTSEKEAEITVARGARPVRGTWSVIGGPAIRFVGPDGTVRRFGVTTDGLHDGGASFEPPAKSAWLAALAADAARREEPARQTVRTTGASVCYLERIAAGEGDWFESDEVGVAVALREQDAKTLHLRFPDGTEMKLVRNGPGWDDATPGVAQAFDERRARLTCQQNLSGIGRILVSLRVTSGWRPKHDGVAWILELRKSREWIRPGDESVFRCPGDPARQGLAAARASTEYDTMDLANPPRGLCSYAGRDFTSFPLDPESAEREPIACCRQGDDGRTPHHKGGICVAFDDASVAFLTPKDLGLSPGDPIVVGPDSKSPILRKLVYVKKR